MSILLHRIKKAIVSFQKKNRTIEKFLFKLGKNDSDFLSLFQHYLNFKNSKISLSEIDFSSDEKVWGILGSYLQEIFPGLEKFEANEYLLFNQDVQSAINKNLLQSAIEHYLKSGLREVYLGQRALNGSFDKESSFDSLSLNKADFIASDYIITVKNTLDENIDKHDAWDHFIKKGFSLVKNGRLELYPGVGLYSQKNYLQNFKDVAPQLLLGRVTSPLEHFFNHGAREIKEGRRKYNLTENRYLYVPPIKCKEVESLLRTFDYNPLISIVMPVYNVSPIWLEKAYNSLVLQWYTNWELCICDDGSTSVDTLNYLKQLQKKSNVKVHFSGLNQNISLASNIAFKESSGEYIALMDNDDELTIDALFEVVKVLQDVNIDFIYSDEDKLELTGEHSDVHFKPDFSPDMFLAHNYMSHLGVIRRTLIEEVNGWRTGYEGAQDYDLYLRVLDKEPTIAHIPKVLYHWRKIPGSTAAVFSDKNYAQEAGRLALCDTLERRDIDGDVVNGLTPGTYRIKYSIVNQPLVSVIVPFKDKPELLIQCLTSILKYSYAYDNFEVICIDNGSTDKEIKEIRQLYQSKYKRIKFYDFKGPFNYSRINNEAVRLYAKGDFILFMNNDIEVINEEWITGLLEHCQRKEVGAVGAKLLYSNNKVQHAGLILAPDTGHAIINAFKNQNSDYPSYFSRLHCISNFSAVTAALMMVSRNDFDDVGGFDEVNLAVAYNDVDLCLRLLEKGKFNIFTPYVVAYHYESASRGLDDNFTKLNQQRKELFFLKSLRKEHFTQPDKFYSPNLTQFSEDFMVNKANSHEYLSVRAKGFYENILYDKKLKDFSKKTLTFFSHYDRDGLIDDYVVEYLKRLSDVSDIIFISTSCSVTSHNLERIEGYVCHLIFKENIGYDFGAWRTGITKFYDQLDTFETIIICNDSVYGPMSSDFNPELELNSRELDALAITDSFEIKYHLQSYFIAMNKNVFLSMGFKDFWFKMKIYEDKTTLILKHELGFSQMLTDSNFNIGAIAMAEDIGYVNNTHIQWERCLLEFGSNFIKVELLRDNPCEVDINNYKKVLEGEFSYPVSLIENHLNRFV